MRELEGRRESIRGDGKFHSISPCFFLFFFFFSDFLSNFEVHSEIRISFEKEQSLFFDLFILLKGIKRFEVV